MNAAPAPAPLAVIETDAFCERCGFNLRSRPVWRDERLGLLVCQCPECGGYQSATGRATALTPWLHRLALLAAIVWVGLSIAYAAALFGSLFGLQAIASESLTVHSMRTPDGTWVNFNWNNGKQTLVKDDGTPVTADRVIIKRDFGPFIGGPPLPPSHYYFGRTAEARTWLAISGTIFAAGFYAAAAIVAAGTWFWRPWLRWLWLALPVLVCAMVVLLVRADDRTSYYPVNDDDQAPIALVHDHSAEFTIIAVVAALQIAVFALALLTGRKLVRGVLTVFAPPGVRQLFAFLWHCDGKTMPAARASATRHSS